MKTKTLFAALALTIAMPSLAQALPRCSVSPHTSCTIDGPADQRRLDATRTKPDGPAPQTARLSETLPMNAPPGPAIVVNRPAPPPPVIINNRTTIVTPPRLPYYPNYVPARRFIPPFSLGGNRRYY